MMTALEVKLSTLEGDKRQLEQESFRTESKIKDYENRLKCTEDDLQILNQELQILRKNNNKLDADYHEKQRAVGTLVNKLNSYEAEMKEKVNLITRQQELISSLSEKGTHLEDKSQGLVRELEQTRVNLRNVGADLIKANEIIRKLQEDGRQLGKKVKVQVSFDIDG
jgi:chromosome segregation ATPase